MRGFVGVEGWVVESRGLLECGICDWVWCIQVEVELVLCEVIWWWAGIGVDVVVLLEGKIVARLRIFVRVDFSPGGGSVTGVQCNAIIECSELGRVH